MWKKTGSNPVSKDSALFHKLLEVKVNSIFFISDAHLGFADPEDEARREKNLLDFFEWISDKADALYIVGDLFDFWFEYASVLPRQFFHILFSLDRLRKIGVAIHFILGNHDCWAQSFFPNALNIPVYHESITPMLQSKRFYIGHGDGLIKKDLGYRVLKKIIRNRAAILAYKTIHPNAAFKTACFFSRLSRNHRSIKDRDREYAAFAQTLFAKGFDRVVLAHTHRPFELREGNRIYINTGDWMTHFTYGRLTAGELTLEQWPPKQSEQDKRMKEHS